VRWQTGFRVSTPVNSYLCMIIFKSVIICKYKIYFNTQNWRLCFARRLLFFGCALLGSSVCVSGTMNACSMVEEVDGVLSAECCNKLASNVRPRPMLDGVSLFSVQVCGQIHQSNYFQTNGLVCDEDSLPGTSKLECPSFFTFVSNRLFPLLCYFIT